MATTIDSLMKEERDSDIAADLLRQDQYFDPTLQNLRDAAALYGYSVKDASLNTSITVNDEWAGETFIFF